MDDGVMKQVQGSNGSCCVCYGEIHFPSAASGLIEAPISDGGSIHSSWRWRVPDRPQLTRYSARKTALEPWKLQSIATPPSIGSGRLNPLIEFIPPCLFLLFHKPTSRLHVRHHVLCRCKSPFDNATGRSYIALCRALNPLKRSSSVADRGPPSPTTSRDGCLSIGM